MIWGICRAVAEPRADVSSRAAEQSVSRTGFKLPNRVRYLSSFIVKTCYQ
jgi:hypothetical protein